MPIGKMKPNEKIAHAELVLDELLRSNSELKRKFIGRVSRWVEQKRHRDNPSHMHSKLQKLEKECEMYKVKVQREQNDVLDKLFRDFERHKEKSHLASRILTLEVADATAQEEFKTLVQDCKRKFDQFPDIVGFSERIF